MNISYTIKKDLSSEANRIFFTLNSIVTGFYQSKRMLLLPKISDSPNVVYLPDLDYQSLDIFPLSFTQDIMLGDEVDYNIKAIENFLKTELIDVTCLIGYKGHIVSTCSVLQKFMEEWFDELPASIEYEILESDYGTTCSWGSFREISDNNYQIKVFIRSDVFRSNLLEALISPTLSFLISRENTDFTWLNNWKSKEYLVDFLLTKTSLSKYALGYIPTVITETTNPEDDILVSSNYYSKLGFPPKSYFAVDDEELTLETKPVGGIFTQTELRVIMKFVQQRGQVLTFDDIAEEIWPENTSEMFSLESIAKIIQKIRDKIEMLGYSRSIIRTKRGIGYVFWD
jgi:hypothetical protein